MRKASKILVYSSILIVAIYLFISIAKGYIAHVYLYEYEKSLKEGDIERQGHLLRRSLELCPSNAKTHFELGKLYIDENPIDKDSEAGIKSYTRYKEIFQEALTLKPTEGRRRAEYAWYIGSNGDENEAIEQFNIAINLYPIDTYPRSLYAMWRINQVKYEIDLTNTDQFVENYRNRQQRDETLKSYDDRSINGVSIAVLLNTSREEWDKVLSFRAPRDRYEYESLADLDFLNFELDKAIRNYTQAKNKYMLARCYIIKEEYNRAINILAGILQGDGKLSRSSLSKTKKLLLDVIKYGPKNNQPFYWLGKLHMHLGEVEWAVINYKLSIHLNSEHIDSRLSIAELYNQTGKIDLAIKEYQIILEQAPNHKEASRLLSEAVMFEYKDADFLKVP